MNSSSATLDTSPAMLHQNGGVSERSDLLHSSVQGLKRVALYVLGEKAQMKVRDHLNSLESNTNRESYTISLNGFACDV